MRQISEERFILNYNKACGQVLGCERRKRNLTLEKLSMGILSPSRLKKVENGTAQWTKLTGDTLLLRMGIPPEYFESLASGEELERWRLREDICLLISGHPLEAAARIDGYRNRCQKREPLEDQFLLKAEAILMLSRQGSPEKQEDREKTLDTARRAVECTVREGWEQNLEGFCLSPGELEAILLFGAALFQNNRKAEGWQLWTAVWNYPGAHQWGERLMTLILPQAAILGLWEVFFSDSPSSAKTAGADSPDGKAVSGESLGKNFSAGKAATVETGETDTSSRKEMASKGREALELLRRNGCHCYAQPLLDMLCGIDAALFGEPGYREQLLRFREMFREIYEWFHYPGYRIWQGISVDNTRDAGMTLKMLRMLYGKSREKAVFDGDEPVVTPRQLEKIEKGIHKPSYENYRRLAKQYGKCGSWQIPMVETDSVEVLEQRQMICYLIEYNRWEQAEWEIRKFHKMVNPDYPRVKQELLCFDASLKWKRDGALQESLEMMLEALRCTVPSFDGKDMKWWVYQREEIIIASNIGSLYYRLGNQEKAKEWFESILFSIKQLNFRTGIYNCGYQIASLGYSNFLGTIQHFKTAMETNQSTAEKCLLTSKIDCFQYLLYHIAWNTYEMAILKPEDRESFRPKWRKAFWLSQSVAEFIQDTYLTMLLKEKETKFLS